MAGCYSKDFFCITVWLPLTTLPGVLWGLGWGRSIWYFIQLQCTHSKVNFKGNNIQPMQICVLVIFSNKMIRSTTKWHVRPGKTQISLEIRPVWPESSLCDWRKFNYLPLSTHNAHNEDSDQTDRMPRLSWVFAARDVIFFCCCCCCFVVLRLKCEMTMIRTVWSVPVLFTG